jgi:hypothetical protein
MQVTVAGLYVSVGTRIPPGVITLPSSFLLGSTLDITFMTMLHCWVFSLHGHPMQKHVVRYIWTRTTLALNILLFIVPVLTMCFHSLHRSAEVTVVLQTLVTALIASVQVFVARHRAMKALLASPSLRPGQSTHLDTVMHLDEGGNMEWAHHHEEVPVQSPTSIHGAVEEVSHVEAEQMFNETGNAEAIHGVYPALNMHGMAPSQSTRSEEQK